MQPSDLHLFAATERTRALTSPAAALLPLAAAWLLVGCGATAPQAATPPPPPVAAVAPAPVEVKTQDHTPRAEPPPLPAPSPVLQVLAQTDLTLRMGPAELAREISRLSDAEEASAETPLLLATALAQTRQAVDTARALGLVQRVLANQSAASQALHPLARLMEARLLNLRRLEDQLDRQTQQLRDAQRRNDQLNERLEAVRAIERSLTTRPPVPAAPASSPGNGPQRSAP
ncbi:MULTISPECIES: hypothetical protein [unclassified Acidovorax]|uniref:hypothetical protein n=1 Tax=unclassified Acidovorax TaxID=2684926 RepID=UPI0037C9AA1F